MSEFLNQIKEDLQLIKSSNPHLVHKEKDEWLFNYWILDNIYNVDADLIESQIIEYSDMGVDGYEFFEETKDLYVVQNKFYSESTKLSYEYVVNDFLLRPVNSLKNGTYKKSKELQNIYNKYKDSDDFKIYFELYVTNNIVDEKIINYVKNFNTKDPKLVARIYYLNDIKEKYYGEIHQNTANFSVDIDTIVKGTILNINSKSYQLRNIIDARYVFTPITTIYRLFRDASEKKYPIFDRNIREYLGNTGVNKNIVKTLMDPEDRINFFYYNNGITVICNKMSSISVVPKSNFNRNAKFTVENPQIVNGCQTVNSIYDVLKNVNPDKLEDEFKDTFVMLKVLQISDSNNSHKQLYEDIVRYNNSQNAIDEKSFVFNNHLFIRLQRELEKRGFLLLIKQSDKNTFKNMYKTNLHELRSACNSICEKFNISFERVEDHFIPMEKLLQVILSFYVGGFEAFTKKSSILKFNSEYYKKVVNVLKEDNFTHDTLLNLWMLYLSSEKAKKNSSDSKTPISYYLLDCFAKYDCKERKFSLINSSLLNSENIKKIIDLYSKVTKAYSNEFKQEHNIEYNALIKKPIAYEVIDKYVNILRNV